MSKEEFLKIQTCVLKVNIHCEGCKHKVKKTLHKIEGVYTTAIDAELGKVTVSGNVDPATLIKKLNKNGKLAEIWGAPSKPSTNVNNLNQMNQIMKNLQLNEMKNLQLGNGKNGGGNNKNQPQKGQVNLSQHIKGIQDLKNQLPPLKLPVNGKDQKAVKFMLPEEEDDLSDDEFESDEEFDDYDDEDDDLEDDDDYELEDEIESKSKPVIWKNTPQMMMKNMMNPPKKGPNFPVPISFSGGDKKGGGGGNLSQGKCGKNGNPESKNGDGIPAKHGGSGAGAGSGGGGGGAANFLTNNGSKKSMIDGPHGMPNIMSMNAASSGMGNMAMARPLMNQIPNFPSFPAITAAAGGDPVAGNPYHQQQQYAAMMMNAQRDNGNERFQPMMYARPPPAVSYMPSAAYPPPYLYYPPPRHDDRGDDYSMFSDENTQSCRIM